MFNLGEDCFKFKDGISMGLNEKCNTRKCEAYAIINCEAYVMPYRIRVFEIYETKPNSHDRSRYEVRVPKCVSDKFYGPIEDLREWLRG